MPPSADDNRKKRLHALTQKWSIFLLTSCLSTLPFLDPADIVTANERGPSGPGHAPSPLTQDQHELMNLSVGEIVDEFFGPEGESAAAWAGFSPAWAGSPDLHPEQIVNPGPQPTPLPPDIEDSPPDPLPEVIINPGVAPYPEPYYIDYPDPDPGPDPWPDPDPYTPGPDPDPYGPDPYTPGPDPYGPDPYTPGPDPYPPDPYPPEPYAPYPAPYEPYPAPYEEYYDEEYYQEYYEEYYPYPYGYYEYYYTYYDTYYDTYYYSYYDTYYDTYYDCYYDTPYAYTPSYPAPAPEPTYDTPGDYDEVAHLPNLPFAEAAPQDTRYRDMCINTAALDQDQFDPETGKVIAPDIGRYWGGYFFGFYETGGGYGGYGGYYDEYYGGYYGYFESSPESVSTFDQKFVGKVSGAKPPLGVCMPIKDTPVVQVDEQQLELNPNLAFGTFLNMDDRPFGLLSASDQDATNYYKNLTFFVGGALGCPDILEPVEPNVAPNEDLPGPQPIAVTRPNILEMAKFWRYKAENCYNYYILSRARAPWFVMERPGIGTDDPLSMFDPDRTYLNSCQPLVSGWHAKAIRYAAMTDDGSLDPNAVQMEKEAGFAPVLQYHRADMDEAEYRLSDYLQAAWNSNFVSLPEEGSYQIKQGMEMHMNFQPIGLPCVTNALGGGGGEEPGPFPLPTPENTPQPEPAPVDYGDGGYNPAPPVQYGGVCAPAGGYEGYADYDYYPSYEASYDSCTDRFNVPKHLNYVSPGKVAPYYCPNVEKITEPSHPFSPRHDIIKTDRSYSDDTSKVFTDCEGNRHFGYTDYNPDPPSGIQGRSPYEREMYPVVQCALVPVDILSFRAPAFDNCIQQRININFNAWIDAGYPIQTLEGQLGGGGWRPPCATRFWESDQGSCPAVMSIQQCCRIITKDLVPANFLKMRTAEGLLQMRRDDEELQEALGRTTDNPITYLTDQPLAGDGYGGYEESGGYGGYGGGQGMGGVATGVTNYADLENIMDATIRLNEVLGLGSEPPEYRFNHWFQPFYKPANPDAPDPETDGKLVGYHMPYMRWWDTGVSAGNSRHGGSFINTLGGFDSLIGVGREERDKVAAEQTKEEIDDIGGLPWTASHSARLSQPQRSEMGRVGGWAELKAHQMWTLRRSNLFCIGRYEKLVKPYGPENFALYKAGSGYTSRIGIQWPWPLGWRGYATDTTGHAFPGAFQNATILNENNPPYLAGLDNALPGDIITYDINGLKQVFYVTDIGGYALEGSDVPLPGDVKAVFNFATKRYHLGNENGAPLHPTRLFVVGWDQGKFPGATGSGLNIGMGPERTIYKIEVPENYRNEICAKEVRALTDYNPVPPPNDPAPITNLECSQSVILDTMDEAKCKELNCQPSCVDPDYTACLLPHGYNDWNAASIYRASADVRRCDESKGASLTPYDPLYSNLNLTATYNWTGPTQALQAPDPTVVYQGLTQWVMTDLWAWCVNSGYDPPAHFAKEYKGAGTGALTDTTLCGPQWGECSTSAGQTRYFPNGPLPTTGTDDDYYPDGYGNNSY